MDEYEYCPVLKSVVVITSTKMETRPMGILGRRAVATAYGCSCEEKCKYIYECQYSSTGKNYDPGLTMVQM